MRARPWALGAITAALGCARELPPAGQILLYVDTDAIVAQPGLEDPGRLSPLVDRARVEVLQDGRPVANSARDVPIDAPMLRDRRLSFGIVPPSGATNVGVRVRLFRADRVLDAEPPPGVTLDTTVVLPPVGDDGIAELSVLLRADDFGGPVGPVPAASGRPAASLVNTWRGGRRVPCGALANASEACVPGAAFFFGNPQFRGRSPGIDIHDERVVVLSPFFLDRTEVTIEAFRAKWSSLSGRVAEPTSKGVDPFCAWTPAPDGDNERRALNCIPWATAEAYCELDGKQLPSEAQFELVASGLGAELAFPWGDDEPDCKAAVWGCAGIESATNDAIKRGASDCRDARGGPGPFQPGLGLLDRVIATEGSTAEIVDLGGNLAEWSRDVWARSTDPFWAGVRPMFDPVNSQPNPMDGDLRTIRGGDWVSTVLVTRAGFRRKQAAIASPLYGFRCARPARQH